MVNVYVADVAAVVSTLENWPVAVTEFYESTLWSVEGNGKALETSKSVIGQLALAEVNVSATVNYAVNAASVKTWDWLAANEAAAGRMAVEAGPQLYVIEN